MYDINVSLICKIIDDLRYIIFQNILVQITQRPKIAYLIRIYYNSLQSNQCMRNETKRSFWSLYPNVY
jgi:hypothetical protein